MREPGGCRRHELGGMALAGRCPLCAETEREVIACAEALVGFRECGGRGGEGDPLLKSRQLPLAVASFPEVADRLPRSAEEAKCTSP